MKSARDKVGLLVSVPGQN